MSWSHENFSSTAARSHLYLLGVALGTIYLPVLHPWETESNFETFSRVVICYHKHRTLVVNQVLLRKPFRHWVFGGCSRFFNKLRVSKWPLLS